MSREQAHAAWRSAEQIKHLSDRLVGIGPIGIGLDGMLAWIPGANLVYGLSAGGLLLMHAVRAKASPATLARMGAYLAVDNLTDAVPILGWAADTLFPGHLMAAKALQKDIEARHGLPEDTQVSLRGKRLWSGRTPVKAR
ncbi:MAG TPA: DUF4112 domain-containing protein [Caulobacteraceae bacterium]